MIELYVISNPTNKVIVSDSGKPILSFKLPADATNLQFESGALGQRYTQTANGFGDTQAVLPGSGQDQEIFAFDLPYNQKLNLDLPITLPVSAAVVLLPVNSVTIQSSQLVNSGQQSVQGQTFDVYASSNLNAGSTLSMVISGSPGASVAAGATGSLANIILGGGVFVVALAIAGFAFYRRRSKPKEIVEGDLPEAVEEDADSLIDAIAALDDLYKDGELPEAAYQLRREEMKARLKRIFQETGINPK